MASSFPEEGREEDGRVTPFSDSSAAGSVGGDDDDDGNVDINLDFGGSIIAPGCWTMTSTSSPYQSYRFDDEWEGKCKVARWSHSSALPSRESTTANFHGEGMQQGMWEFSDTTASNFFAEYGCHVVMRFGPSSSDAAEEDEMWTRERKQFFSSDPDRAYFMSSSSPPRRG